MTVTAALVKQLREQTGAGMMDCKKYLQKTNGDIDAAIQAMREDGQARAAKKSSRTAAEGLVQTQLNGQQEAAIIEVNSETDFVSKNDDFKVFVQTLLAQGLAQHAVDAEALMGMPLGDSTVVVARQNLVLKLGENIQLRRFERILTKHQVADYMHGDRIGVLVEYTGGDEQLGRDLAMHIAALNPMVISHDEVSSELIAKERAIATTQAEKSKKPVDIMEKIVAGRLKNYLNEVSLLGQTFVKDSSLSIEQLLQQKGATVHRFVRYEVGEGIEKEQKDFAQEVMDQVKGS